MAPDVIHIGDLYYLYIAAHSDPTKADINLLMNRTLDPNSPDYKWEARLKESGLTAFIDPEGYKKFVADKEQAFETELAKQRAALPRSQ